MKNSKCLVNALVVAMSFMVAFQLQANPRDPKQAAARIGLIAPAQPGEFRLRATFCSISAYFGSAEDVPGLSLQYRQTGGEWRTARPMPYFPETKDFRGSICNLAEDTTYEVRVVANDKPLASGNIRTWKSDVPVAKTILLDPATAAFPMTISDQGTPDGWIRYTAKSGSVLCTKTIKDAILVAGAKYVLFDDLVIRGETDECCVFRIKDSVGVRIRNCEISGWGRVGKACFDEVCFGKRRGKGKRAINMDGAIQICRGSSEVTVERCYVHDPAGRANSWFYSHPAGPEAVIMYSPDHSCVIRWNDFVGSDNHRYNDAVEGGGNFFEDGGFNRDADIYGNFMIFCNDDNIELDGGQQNVRCFHNRFEQAVSGVSIQGCMVSPSYVFENDFTGMGDELSIAYNSIKTSGIDLYDYAPVAYVNDNVFWGPSGAIDLGKPTVRYTLENNRVYGKAEIRSAQPNAKVSGTVKADEDPMGAPIVKPIRPLPLALDRGKIAGVKVAAGVVSPAQTTFSLACEGEGCTVPFVVRKNLDMDWFEVSPSAGIIHSGEKLQLTVKFISEKMKGRRHFRGAFLIRTKEGLSRPVSVYAETDEVPPFKAEKDGEFAQYQDVFSPINANHAPIKIVEDVNGVNGKMMLLGPEHAKKGLDYAFDVPKDGRYYVHIHGYAERSVSIIGAMDDDEEGRGTQVVQKFCSWTPFGPGGAKFRDVRFRFWDLKAGRHVVHIKPRGNVEYRVDGIVITDSPESFEPR